MSGFDLHRGDVPAYDIQGRYITELFTDESVKIIERHDINHPLYLQINHLGVHAPLERPPAFYGERNFNYLSKDQKRQTYASELFIFTNSLIKFLFMKIIF